MSVVRFKRTRRRLSIRYYLCTDDGPVRLPLRLCRDLADRVIALPQFANSVQRMVEVLIESKAKVAGGWSKSRWSVPIFS